MSLRSEIWNEPLTVLGRSAVNVTQALGAVFLFMFEALAKIFVPPFRFYYILQQIHFIGMKSLFVVGLTGLFTGMVLGLQGYYTLVQYGSESVLGAAVTLSLLRELGPVLTALMITGRTGSSMAAEIGIMRISEQIDALDTMDIDPVHFLIVPRYIAALISFPLLTAIFDCIGIMGGYISGVILMQINAGTYMNHMVSGVVMNDVTSGFLKAFVFALIVTTISCYQGFYAHKRGFGAKGVSAATTSAVVVSSVLILVTDYIMTSFLI
ncbi:ABC transporter permease [Candidatus Sumerlaeota bacterium]|nr:ABC transporter permease [Candidatus Sumerlaeota bacterium]